MHFSQKDKSLILFICAALVVLWALSSVASKIFFKASFNISDVNKIVTSDGKWLNSTRKIEISDLKDRAILLHFWNRSCISCVEALPDIKKLENELGSKITVIGVYSSKFENEKDLSVIRNAVLKHDITSLVLTDTDLKLWKKFKVNAWPTFILINPNGREYERHEGINSVKKLVKDAKSMVNKYRYQINREPLPLLPEKYNQIGNILSFPSKLEYTSNFIDGSRATSAIFIANSGQNNIVATSLIGGILFKIGSGKEGLADGNFEEAAFNAPQGILFDDQKLYIADTGNHALRVADFKTRKVTTLTAGGKKGGIISATTDAVETNLSSPTDIEFFPSKDVIVISNSGSNQILSFNLKTNKISVLAGNGESGKTDGKYPNNSLAQTSDMVVLKNKLYFLDAITSALRVLDEAGNVRTLASSGLQHPLALTADDSGIYIADSFNNRIRKYGVSTQKLTDLVGGEIGDAVGSKTRFNSPEGIISIMNSFYISDANNNRVLVVNRSKLHSELLDVIPPLKLPREGFLEYLPNLKKSEPASVKADEKITLKIDLNKGWKINEDGPSFINLLEIIDEDKANLLASFDWYFVKQKEMKLPKLSAGKDYLLQGVIYYCEDKSNALCYVKSYEQKVSVGDDKSVQIDIKLAY